MMEPNAAAQWADVASRILAGENIPLGPSRDYFYKTFYRVDEKGNLSLNGPVQVMNISGPIIKYDYCGSPGTESMTRQLAAANADSSIKSIILFMDSPGGSVDGTEDFAKAVKASAKPVVTFVNSMMASAAYWIGSAAKEVVVTGANNGYNAIVGSIGTMATWKDVSESNAKNGVKIHEVYASASKDKNADFREANAGNYTSLIKNYLDPLNNTFINAVQANREGKLQPDVENIFTGKSYNAKQAVKFGLADRIGDFKSVVRSSLKLANQQNSNSMKPYALTLKASKAESFESMNEGIWLTEENIQNIESVLQENETFRLKTEEENRQLFDVSEKDNEEMHTMQEQIAALTAEREALQAQVAELGKQPAPVSATVKTNDEFNGDSVAELEHNRWADKMLNGN